MGYRSNLDVVVEGTLDKIDQCIRGFHSKHADEYWAWGTVRTIDKTLFTRIGVCDNPELEGAASPGEQQWTIIALDVPAPEQAVFCIITASQMPGWINALGDVLNVNCWPDWTVGSYEVSAYIESYKKYLNALLGEFQHRGMIKHFPQWLIEIQESNQKVLADTQMAAKSSKSASALVTDDARTKHITIRQGKLVQFVAFLDEWLYNNRETTPLWWVGPSQRSKPYEAMTWWWIHKKIGANVHGEAMGEAGRGCITAFEVPCGIKIVFELRGFPDPTLFWQTVEEWLEEIDRLGFTELSLDELPEPKFPENSVGNDEKPAEALLASLGDQSPGEAALGCVDRFKLLLILDERFDQEDLRTLSFLLEVDYDNLRGEGKADKARELIGYLARRRRMGELVKTINRMRPDISWGNTLETTSEAALAGIELLLVLDKWWQSIKDYELSMGEMGSASKANVLPQDNRMAVRLENFRISKIKTWPFLDEDRRNAFSQAEEVFLGFIAKVYSGIYNHEVFGDQVPKQIMRNERIEEIIAGNSPFHTFPECKEAYRKLRSQLMD